MTYRIGVYSGTFDPIHLGHMAFAEEAMRLCRLDRVIFLPEQRPRGKNQVTDIAHRIALIKRAITTNANLEVMQLTTEQFSVQKTLPMLRRALGNSHLTFLVGSDVACTLRHWEDLGILLNEVSFAIGLRTGDTPDDMSAIMNQLEHDYSTTIDHSLISTTEATMTSSQIRNGTADAQRLHPNILDYIQEHKLYRVL